MKIENTKLATKVLDKLGGNIMKDEQFKQIYAFVTLGLTVLWAAFCVWITFQAVASKLAVDILVSAGANALLGALIVWNGNIVQFFFRRAKPNGEPK